MKSPGPLLVCRCVVSVWGVLFAPALSYCSFMVGLNSAGLARCLVLIMFSVFAEFGGFVLFVSGRLCAVSR